MIYVANLFCAICNLDKLAATCLGVARAGMCLGCVWEGRSEPEVGLG